jgi:two-component system nitrogen regulation response regulator GlnG
MSIDLPAADKATLDRDLSFLRLVANLLAEAVAAIRHQLEERDSLLAENQRLRSELGDRYRPGNIIGNCSSMKTIYDQIAQVADSSATVLIRGESGTGKELVARALHRHSPRKDAPFIAINTAAIPRDLLESELFGHEKGAFTGAGALRRGRFEQADNGTLFLDEIGDMPAELQTRLLRVLSDGNFYRVGGHQPVKANVRVIAATHQDLEGRVKEGLFREDLFHRLNVIRLRLPPLRERRDDIPLLAKHFLQKSAQELGGEPKYLTDAALKYLQGLDFPGNVRQLENLCHWLTVMAPGQSVDIADLPAELREGPDSARRDLPANWNAALAAEADRLLSAAPGEVFDQLTRQFEATLIRRALNATGGRRIDAAHLLGIGRNTITRKIQELGLDDARTEQAD